MADELLRTFLLTFIFTFLAVILLCSLARTQTIRQLKQTMIENHAIQEKMFQVNILFKLLLILAILVIFLYCFAPQYYLLLAPIESLDDPVINYSGIVILFCSLVWLLFTQIRIHSFFRSVSQSGKTRIINYNWICVHAKTMLSAGIAIMLIGLFVTISNLFAIYLIVIALAAYFIQIRLSDNM
jgi:hypothetical protein